MADDLARFRAVVETLTDEFDVMDVALAAVKLAYDATAGAAADEEEEIPEVVEPIGPRRPGRRTDTGRHGGVSDGNFTRLFIGLGRRAGIRPQDLVGAIAGESHLRGRDIGAIEIADRFSLVEVPEAAADQVVDALRHSRIKGRKAGVRRERGRADRRPR